MNDWPLVLQLGFWMLTFPTVFVGMKTMVLVAQNPEAVMHKLRDVFGNAGRGIASWWAAYWSYLLFVYLLIAFGLTIAGLVLIWG